MEYYTKYGKFQYPRTTRLCAKCGEEKEIQLDSVLCDECIIDLMIEKMENGEYNHKISEELGLSGE